MEDGRNVRIWLNVGNEGGIWRTPSSLSYRDGHYHSEATSEVEITWGEAEFVSRVVGWSLWQR